MPFQSTFRSHSRFFLTIVLVSWLTVAVLGHTSFASQQTPAPADFEAATKSATAAREAGHADEAIQNYRRALELNSRWEEGWWYLGTLLYDADLYSAAIPAFQKLVELVPSAGPAWNFLGLCEFEIRDYPKALEHLQKGLAFGDADDPDTARVAKYHLALLLIRSGDFDQAAPLLATIIGENEAPSQIKIALALATLRVPLLPKEIDPSQDALLNAVGEAESALAQNNSAKALAVFPSLLEGYPAIPYLHYAYGKALASAGEHGEALKQQREETRVSPSSPLPWIEISQLELSQRPQDALHAAQEAVQRSPESFGAHKTLGQVLQVLGEKEKAAQELALAENLTPGKPQPEARIAQLYSNHTIGGSEEIAPAANDSAAGSFEDLSRRAAMAQSKGDANQAIQNYQRALQLRPEWEEGRWNLAMLYYTAAHYPEAISQLKIWVERHPNVGPAWAVMGLCEFEIKDYKNALVHLQRSEQLGFGGSPQAEGLARYHLAILENQNSQFESAMQALLPGARSVTAASEVQIALGMALLHIPLRPDQLEPSKIALVQSAGEIGALLVNSKYDQAFPKLQFLLKQYPSVPFLHYAYGTALAALSQFDEAEIQLRAELQLSPQSELPYVSLASLALKRYRPQEALAAAQRAVELAPESADAHYVMGRAHLELGDNKLAVDEFEQASKLAPGSPEVHFNLAKAYAKAKLPEKAEQERAIFARLNALSEQRRSHSGSQAYKGSNDAVELTPAHTAIQSSAAPR